MNKTAKFGYELYGSYVAVKLNVCLTSSNVNELECTYKEWLHFYPGYKRRTRIEGVLPCNAMSEFRKDLELAMLRSKISKLQEQEKNVLSAHLNIDKPVNIYEPIFFVQKL